ncbi:MAG: hypothetical protein K9L30_03875 [Desulfobacterales bacterium]|nr:hypothetical protein [Desulfobacterales bacterium]
MLPDSAAESGSFFAHFTPYHDIDIAHDSYGCIDPIAAVCADRAAKAEGACVFFAGHCLMKLK